nr:helix-turn-helix transcriptional regulator [Pseudomonas sp.]
MLGPFNLNNPCHRDLTPREREVLDYVLAGKPNKLTAYSLGISQRTVEVHRSRIFQKLGVRNAIELVTAVYTRDSFAARLLAEPLSIQQAACQQVKEPTETSSAPL